VLDDGIPWERRAQLGTVAAFLETIREVLAKPSRLFASVSRGAGIGPALLFGVTVGYLGIVVSAVYGLVINLTFGSALSQLDDSGFSRLSVAQSGLGFVLQLLLGPFLVVIGMFLAAAVLHVWLAILGAGGGFEATFQVVSYGQAVAVFNLLPVCGGLLALPYLFVLLVVGASAAHRIGEGRAYAAVLLAGLSVGCCALGVVVAFLGGLAGVAGLAGGR
jgi:hypothetical protein